MTSSAVPAVTRQHLWRTDITGLRALAVLPVLLFHAFPDYLSGGFFGVDIFFVISGYLISGIIFRGLLSNTFSYADFYAKRIRRILPNLMLVLAFCFIMGWFWMSAREYATLGQHIYASAGFYQNFRLMGEAGYFDAASETKPLLHLWSLAIEEQFYIVFPIICVAVWKLTQSPRAILTVVLSITLGSLAACLAVVNPAAGNRTEIGPRFATRTFARGAPYDRRCHGMLSKDDACAGIGFVVSGGRGHAVDLGA